MPTNLIAITGATGQQGGAVAHALLKAGHKIRAITRNPDGPAAKALAKQGAEIARAELDDVASLRAALKGAWGVFGVQNTWTAGVEGEEAQGHRLAKVAKEIGVQHYVYTSVASAHRKTGIPHFDNKARVEETVRSVGFPSWAIIRPVFFMENLLSPSFKPYIDKGSLAVGIKPGTRLQMIALQDIGEYGRLAFERADLKGTALDIAGDEPTTPEAAAVLSKVAKRPITHFQVPIADVRKASDDFATMLEWFDRVGYDVDIAANAKKYGVKPTKFADWAAAQAW
ncbi:MAG: NmrA/HSCARG family protein [Gemmatimonadales bacterium]